MRTFQTKIHLRLFLSLKIGFIRNTRAIYPHITKAIQEIKPDLVFVDELMTSPVGIDQGIKYVVLLSSNPVSNFFYFASEF